MKINGIHTEQGQILYYRLDNGRIVTPNECIDLIREGSIENGTLSKSKKGLVFIKNKHRNSKLTDFEAF
jgi:hypothetical protein